MSFQWIFDKCETLSINNKKMVATTTARDGTVRVVSRGTQPRRFELKLPDGMKWSVIKDDITAAETLDRITTDEVSISDPGFAWYYGGTMPETPEVVTVRCVDFPQWTIFARDQVSWSGPFVFVEVE